ncbi:EamA/RhaT family transporter [Photobacterium gaetbulicola]|uniref:DMT family permease n=1 Tax=Photobacterium gaetbulicola Gung47 TaxID=658445 RepID=A0A0C5W9C6_9GAMM|nr:DMT family transporter [Photobacterium gaetbulicola]AJR08156.1 DMT family permease [Photobacterium gaetbulicola Gung47]PSU13035.1 EamA/RhaT family transporter [Photobacterium gaetbulicola]
MRSPVNQAIVLLVAANLLASFSDVSLKILNGEVPTFQYVFIRQLLSVIMLLPFWLALPREKRHQGCCKIAFWRAQLILMGSACAMIAITFLPLATANAMFYVGPLLMLPLSVLLLKETPPRSKVIATSIGFAGVLVVLRPEHFHWAAIAGLGSALSMGLGNILIRKLPQEQHLVSTLFWTGVMTLPLSLALAVPQWADIEWRHVGWIMAINLFVLGYHALVVIGYKKAAAGQIALAEYSGLVFVTAFGVMWFDEIPDLLTLAGILLIVVPMMPVNWKRLLKGKRSRAITEP